LKEIFKRANYTLLWSLTAVLLYIDWVWTYALIGKILFAQVRNDSDRWTPTSQTLIEEKALGEPRHMIQNLRGDTYYRIEIRARNVIGRSEPTELIIKTAPIVGGNAHIVFLFTLSIIHTLG